jgi:hypothetical protein
MEDTEVSETQSCAEEDMVPAGIPRLLYSPPFPDRDYPRPIAVRSTRLPPCHSWRRTRVSLRRDGL